MGMELPKKGQSKYRNRPVTIEGIRFASGREAKRWRELRLMEQAGLISALATQVTFPLTVNGQLICKYIADFVYFDEKEGREVIEDAKGFRTPAYKIKRKLLLALRGQTIREV